MRPFPAPAFALTLALLASPTDSPALPHAYLLQWGTQGSGPGQRNNPYAIAVDADANVYVSDFWNHRIQKFDSNGNFLLAWGSMGTQSGQMNNPFGVTVGPNGDVYVADYGNNRIQVFTGSGTFVRRWGTTGSLAGQFHQPSGVAIDANGDVYVTDQDNHRIQVFTPTGTYLRQWGGFGQATGQFRNPYGIAAEGTTIYIADIQNFRIQKFSADGTHLGQWPIDRPYGVAVDGKGGVYVANRYVIEQFTESGVFVDRWGDRGSGNGQFLYAEGIAIDSDGNFYVADTGNNRVQKFGDPATPAVPASWGRIKGTYRR